MQTSLTKTNAHTVELTIKDSTKEFEKAKANAIEHLKEHANLKGFRKGGHIPDDLIVKQFGEAAITEHAVDDYVNSVYRKALLKENIIPVGSGEITKVVSLSPIEIVIVVEVLPDAIVDEKKLSKINVKKTLASVDEADVDMAINQIETRFTKFEKTENLDATIENGDRVVIEANGFTAKDGEAIPETRVQSFPLVIGSKAFIPGFEEQLVGHKVGEVVEFDITFPDTYHAEEFKNRNVYFVVTVFGLEKATKPEWTEAFIEGLRGVKTDMAGFREIIKKEVLAERERTVRMKDEEKLLDALLEAGTVELGEKVIAHETDRVFEEQAQNLAQSGYKMTDYLGHMQMDEETYKKQFLATEAVRRLKAELILKKIRELRKIEPTEAEVQAEIDKVIANYHNADVVKRLKEKLVAGSEMYEDLLARLAYRKAVDSFLV